jgi:hypothetical protein
MYCNIFFGTSHTTNRMSSDFALNRGAFVLEILSPRVVCLKYTKSMGGLKGLSEPGARNLGHLAYATLGDPPRRGNLFRSAHARHKRVSALPRIYSIPISAPRINHLRSRGRLSRKGFGISRRPMGGSSVGSPTCSTLCSQWLRL